MTVWLWPRSGITSSHVAELPAIPWSRTRSGPRPALR